ncbi:MAG: glycosyl hydrolase, partial [Flavisolibacter sp.]
PCKSDYLKQVDLIVNRTNHVTGKKYKDETAIMSWELANEPRPMRPSAIEDYKKWVSEVAVFIRSKDKNHLITTGVEGEMGTENISVFEDIHKDKNVDYLTIHIWPKNWSWFQTPTMEKDLPQVVSKTVEYINKHIAVAKKLNKPLVIEEFGLPRDHHSIDASSSTTLRNRYYDTIFSTWQQHAKTNDVVAGVNFWAYGGQANQIKGQEFWKKGDPYMGDPPMEEQGLNSVFDSDRSTWDLIYDYTSNNLIQSKSDGPSDQLATKQTVNLLRNLKKLKEKGIMFGHQDALAYGVSWKYLAGRSDVKDVVGDYPAVYGWELGNLEHNLPYNLDSVPFDKMKTFIQQAYARGGVNTISWHNDHPLNGESAWDTTHGAVASVLPGGERHELYKTWLDRLATFLKSLKGKNGEYIPILFRPYHELTGNWFWWCKNSTTPTEYKLLWRFTADYLKNVKGIHHLLYVYNTSGNFKTREAFLEYYPGDDVVDMISFDTYQHGDASKDNSFAESVNKELGIITEIAKEKNKLAAFAETGYETIPYTEWWTNTLWKSIKDHKISYVLVWRNHGKMGNKMHYYAPHKGHPSSNDFIKFYKLKQTLFEKDIAVEKLYN